MFIAGGERLEITHQGAESGQLCGRGSRAAVDKDSPGVTTCLTSGLAKY